MIDPAPMMHHMGVFGIWDNWKRLAIGMSPTIDSWYICVSYIVDQEDLPSVRSSRGNHLSH